MAIKDSEGSCYEWVKATVSIIDEEVRLAYQISEDGAPQGSSSIDDPTCVEWSNDDVREMTAAMLDIAEGKDEIEVIFD